MDTTLDSNSYNVSAIGYVTSPYKEKFGIPRQPGLVKHAKGSIALSNEFNNIQIVEGLEQYSHVWVMFIFHETQAQGWKPQVRPPRLGGNKKIGVLATRSTFRPNAIGMSVVKLEDICINDKQVTMMVSGLDILDGTPVLDIKPYIPYSDSINDAKAGLAQNAPHNLLTVSYSEKANNKLTVLKALPPYIKEFISEVLAQDPRPAYKKLKTDTKIYAVQLYDLNITWHLLSSTEIEVINITINN